MNKVGRLFPTIVSEPCAKIATNAEIKRFIAAHEIDLDSVDLLETL